MNLAPVRRSIAPKAVCCCLAAALLAVPLAVLAQSTASTVPPGESAAELGAVTACAPGAAGCVAARAAPVPSLLDRAAADDQAARAKAQAEQARAEQAQQERERLQQAHPGTIFVFGDSPRAPVESVHDKFNQALGSGTQSLTSSTFDASGHRTECVNLCYGPMCCVTTPSAADPRR